uniref:C2H2-type domain-containing protein n=1 Tax=Panagrolaimus superbus TaxID=310955 RepID=A0A914YLJ7_9BILA
MSLIPNILNLIIEHARHGEEYDRQDLDEEYQNNNDGIILIDEIENVPVEPEHAASSASLEFVCETPENSRVMKSAFGSTFKVPNKTAKELTAQDAEQLLIRQKKWILITLLKNLLLMVKCAICPKVFIKSGGHLNRHKESHKKATTEVTTKLKQSEDFSSLNAIVLRDFNEAEKLVISDGFAACSVDGLMPFSLIEKRSIQNLIVRLVNMG